MILLYQRGLIRFGVDRRLGGNEIDTI